LFHLDFIYKGYFYRFNPEIFKKLSFMVINYPDDGLLNQNSA